MQNLIFPEEEISRLTLPQKSQELYSTSLYACQRLRSERVLTVEDCIFGREGGGKAEAYERRDIEGPSLCGFMGRPAPSCTVKVQ